MPLLWTPTYVQGENFALPRPYVWGYAFAWTNHTIDVYDRLTIATEHTYGGYKLFVRWKYYWWYWSSKKLRISDLVEDLWVVAPFDPTPITAGAVLVKWQPEPVFHVPMITLTFAGYDGHYSLMQYPSAPPTYYGAPYPPTPQSPFYYP